MATYLNNLTRGSAITSLNLPHSVLLRGWMKEHFICQEPADQLGGRAAGQQDDLRGDYTAPPPCHLPSAGLLRRIASEAV